MSNIKLCTPVNIVKPEMTFSYESVISGIGSCFAQYVMEHFEKLGFNTAYNPNGIVYNAVSIAKSLDYIVNDKDYEPCSFINHNGLWHSWEHYGSFSAPELSQLKSNISRTKSDFRIKMSESDIFILTPSSSVVYCLTDPYTITANCHKYPGKYFERKILSPTDSLEALSGSIKNIRKINKKCLIIITLSPVRHYPGDLTLNARSKANLLSAIHQCVDEFDKVEYFPSYEILLDELRDYRFFNEDMLHPTDLARKFIFQKFISAYFSTDCQKILVKKEKILKSQQHRPTN